MIKVKNNQTGEVVNVSDVMAKDGRIVARWNRPEPTTKAYDTKPIEATSETEWDEEHGVACRVLSLKAGWELVSGVRSRASKGGQPKQAKPRAKKSEPKHETKAEPVPQPEPEPKPQPEQKPATFNATGLEGGLAQVFAPVFQQVAAQIEANIRANVDAEMVDLKRVAEEKARTLKIELPDGTKTKVEGITMDGFDDMVRDLDAGYAVYMYGPAGTGKSHTAKQLADALGLPYYELNQVEFAHEVAGYGDASGKYVPTPLYEAVTKGGLLFFDEFDRSAQSATTIVNTLLANRRFTFPVIGNVEAHPNFRVVAAGNTTMTGASNEYVAANVIDASSRDRFIFYKTYYDERIELPVMAGGDKELVDFMQDLRQSIEKSHIQLVASMRATKYLHTHDNNKRTALERGLFKGMDAEDIRVLYNNLSTKGLTTSWADAMNTLC